MLVIDHVILTTEDIRAEADDLREQTGLAAIEGGRHAGHGTGNWLGPHDLPIELVGSAPGPRRVTVATDHGRVVLDVNTP